MRHAFLGWLLATGALAFPQVNDAKINTKTTTTVTNTVTKDVKVTETDDVLITSTQYITQTQKQVTTTTIVLTVTQTTPAIIVPSSTVTVTTAGSTSTVTAPAQTVTSTDTVTETAVATTVTVTGDAPPASTVTVTAAASTITVTAGSSPTTATTSQTGSTGPTTTTSMTTTAPTSASACTVSQASLISAAVASCTAITLSNIHMPTNTTLDLTKLKAGTHVTFAGTTTFDFTNSSSFNPITVSGANITISGTPGAIIDGNGQAYWDGIGSNGGVPKPDHFFVVSKVTGTSYIQDLYIQNYPTHCFSASNNNGLTFQRITLDNSAGYAPNAVSNGLPAAHNSDGFDLSTTNNSFILDSKVINQDDCVAITSGMNVLVNNVYCNGSHGLSIGSVGGKSNNFVSNITFSNSQCDNCQNGARIKTNSNTTGTITNITYQNIYLTNLETYGIDIQQDYLNGGPTGSPTNGVSISNIFMTNVTGTALPTAQDYYILCGTGSCSNFVFNDIDITGGGIASVCNFNTTGDFVCAP